MPYRFNPIGADSPQSEVIRTLNQNFAALDNETVTKSFKQGGGNNAVIIGRLPYDGGYGILLYDTDGIPRVLEGIAPDGSIGLWVSKDGESVLDAFS